MARSRPGSRDGGYFLVLTDNFHLGAYAQIRYERCVQTNYVKTNTDDLRLSTRPRSKTGNFHTESLPSTRPIGRGLACFSEGAFPVPEGGRVKFAPLQFRRHGLPVLPQFHQLS